MYVGKERFFLKKRTLSVTRTAMKMRLVAISKTISPSIAGWVSRNACNRGFVRTARLLVTVLFRIINGEITSPIATGRSQPEIPSRSRLGLRSVDEKVAGVWGGSRKAESVSAGRSSVETVCETEISDTAD